MRARYGRDVDEGLRARFDELGLPFTPAERVPRSRKALQVTELARDRGLHDTVHDALMEAFWGQGRDIGDEAVLREVAVAAGLDGTEVDDVLASDIHGARIDASTREAVSIGVTGVPAFLLDSRLLVLGAYPLEVFERAFAQLEGRGGERTP